MCGISGVFRASGVLERDRVMVDAMSRAMVHRGPDGEGVFAGDTAHLASRRLRIVGLNSGDQPLYSEDRRVFLIANGEIYNHIELRAELQRAGARFTSGSDCEVILHLYRQRGAPHFLEPLRGMFVFALVDLDAGVGLLARDRMGEKPLLLCEREGALFFSSELRPLVQAGVAPRELEPSSVDAYLHWSYVPEPATIVRGVRKLPAAHLFRFDLKTGQRSARPYWDLGAAPPLAEAPAPALRAALDDTFAITQRSDVPVGVALSGGLDSTLVAALARRGGTSLTAFSVGYPGRPASDERADARRSADKLGIPFVDVEIEESAMVDALPETVLLRDEPIADIAGAGYLEVSRLARRHGVPVLLMGHGGDELFWGYSWVRGALELNRQRDLWSVFRARAGARGTSGSAGAPRAMLRSLLEAVYLTRSTPPGAPIFINSTRDYQEADQWRALLYGPALRDLAWTQGSAGLRREDEPLEVLLTRLICETYLRVNGIAQGDRLSMAASVELRLPLLDHRFVETVIGLRKASPDAHLGPKARLREVAEGLVPPATLERPKQGFRPPTQRWFEAIERRYAPALADGILVEDGFIRRRALDGLFARASSSAMPLTFRLIVLELWCRGVLGD